MRVVQRIVLERNLLLFAAMSFTIRLPPQLQLQLDEYCKSRGISKNRLINELLTRHFAYLTPKSAYLAPKSTKTVYQLAREYGVIGSFSSRERNTRSSRRSPKAIGSGFGMLDARNQRLPLDLDPASLVATKRRPSP